MFPYIPCNFVNNNCQLDSSLLYTLVRKERFGEILEIKRF